MWRAQLQEAISGQRKPLRYRVDAMHHMRCSAVGNLALVMALRSSNEHAGSEMRETESAAI
jgi:hypothetical protein